ncbi:uncharacterized protein [Mobula birostris]|uniref:uncharacterized protein isoform X1 n=1 Tax=Mobula birostris TaxID=1983395 RepID=UPI003B27C260
MERTLRPDKLDLDPQTPEAGNAFELWLACFELYLEEIKATDPAAKRRVLLSRVSPQVCSMIRDQPSYDGVMNTLKGQYLRPINTVYARHRLVTQHQRPGESSAEFVRTLQTLVRDCDCQGLMAGQHAELLVRDAFVTGTRSVYVRQRLLEKADLTLSSAIELADTLEAPLCTTLRLSRHAIPRWPRGHRRPRNPPANRPRLLPVTSSQSATSADSKITPGNAAWPEKLPAPAVERRATLPRSVSPNRKPDQAAPRARHGGHHLACHHLPCTLPPRARHGGSPSCLPPSSLHAATTCELWGRPSWRHLPPPTTKRSTPPRRTKTATQPWLP